MSYAGIAQGFTPVQIDFWSYLADRDYVLVVENTSAQVLREGPKRCGILHTAEIIRTIKGSNLGRTIQFVSAGDIGVGTRAVLLLSKSLNADRKRAFIHETTCVRNPYRWYFGRFAGDHVLPLLGALSTILQADVVEIQSNRFLDDPLFLQDDVQIEGGKVPLSVRDFRRESSIGGHFVMVATIEAAVASDRR
jgi:hypothetical protein